MYNRYSDEPVWLKEIKKLKSFIRGGPMDTLNMTSSSPRPEAPSNRKSVYVSISASFLPYTMADLGVGPPLTHIITSYDRIILMTFGR